MLERVLADSLWLICPLGSILFVVDALWLAESFKLSHWWENFQTHGHLLVLFDVMWLLQLFSPHWHGIAWPWKSKLSKCLIACLGPLDICSFPHSSSDFFLISRSDLTRMRSIGDRFHPCNMFVLPLDNNR